MTDQEALNKLVSAEHYLLLIQQDMDACELVCGKVTEFLVSVDFSRDAQRSDFEEAYQYSEKWRELYGLIVNRAINPEKVSQLGAVIKFFTFRNGQF
jgi:hypothetical protein